MLLGFIGFLQPIADGFKLLIKESIVPFRANKEVFIAAPIFFILTSMAYWSVLPFPGFYVLAHIDLGILYALSVSSLSVYGVILAGWSSNSRYAFLGALRSAAQMISYEVSIGLVFLSIHLVIGSLGFNKSSSISKVCLVHFSFFAYVFFIFCFCISRNKPCSF